MSKIKQVTATALAKHLGRCTRETISDYVAKGVIVKLPNGKFDEDDCRDRAFAHLRDKSAGRSGDLVNERALLAKEQTFAAQMKNAVMKGDYVRLSSVQRVWEGELMVFRERSLTVPGKCADSLTPHTPKDRGQIEDILREEIYSMLDELSNPAMKAQARERGARPDTEGVSP